MAFRKVWFLMWQLIGLGLAQTNLPVAPIQAEEFEAQRRASCQASCPDSYQVYNNFCYRVFSDRKTWDKGEEECTRQRGTNGQGHLVSILSEEENCFVEKIWLETNPPQTGCSSKAWIGFKDGGGNSGFLWSDGNRATGYNNWGKGQPQKGCNKYCAFLRGGVWKTKSCERKMRFICKVPL